MVMQYEKSSGGAQGRSFSFSQYRYGFNNQEKDGELGEYYAFEYRIHDARLGRFLSVDPVASEYPWNSSYAFAENRVIDGIDLEGREKFGAVDNYGTLINKKVDPQSIQKMTMYNGSVAFAENVRELEVVGPEGASWTTTSGVTYIAKPNTVLAFTDDLGIRVSIGYYEGVHKLTDYLQTDNNEPYGNARMYAEQFQIMVGQIGLSTSALESKRRQQVYYDFADWGQKTIFNTGLTLTTMGAGSAISGSRLAMAGFNMLGNASGQFIGNFGSSQDAAQALKDVNVASVAASGIFQATTLSNYLASTLLGSVNLKVGSFDSKFQFKKDLFDGQASGANLLGNVAGNAAGYGLGKIAPHKYDWHIQSNGNQAGLLGGIHNYASGTISTGIGIAIPINNGGSR
jgi:RHS repeat-associated protein